MSPATKSKSKDKVTGKASPTKPISSMAASAYNPLLGTFQVLDSLSIASVSPIQYGRFQRIHETDVNGLESDSVSNHGSCSGESEDHKEKTTILPLRQDSDKREKSRQKNERKHQRQKERRAQELREKSTTYLMSRKLESLTQQLVAMGISQEHATTALMMNQGKVEQSVHWLFDREEGDIEKQSLQSHVNLKIDITEEVARITQLELQLKCTRQEIERAVVQAEGDLDRAEHILKGTKFEELSLPVKLEESCDHLTASSCKHILGTRPVPSPALQPTRDDKNFNYTKSPSTAEPANKRPQPKLDLPKPQQSVVLVDKKWTNTGQAPSASYSLPSSPPKTSVRVEARYISNGIEIKSHQQQQANGEPVVAVRLRPQVVSTDPVVTSSMSASPTTWHPAASIEIMKPNNLNPNQIYQQIQYQNQKGFRNNSVDPHGSSSIPSSLWTRNNTASSSSSISAASSLGLFSAGTLGASSPMDWSSGGLVDYNSIDWSLDQGLSPNTGFNGSWSGAKNSSHMYGWNFNRYRTNGSMGSGVTSSNNSVSMEDAGVGVAVETQTVTSQDWTSPFEGKDIFVLSRQYVSPSL